MPLYSTCVLANFCSYTLLITGSTCELDLYPFVRKAGTVFFKLFPGRYHHPIFPIECVPQGSNLLSFFSAFNQMWLCPISRVLRFGLRGRYAAAKAVASTTLSNSGKVKNLSPAFLLELFSLPLVIMVHSDLCRQSSLDFAEAIHSVPPCNLRMWSSRLSLTYRVTSPSQKARKILLIMYLKFL